MIFIWRADLLKLHGNEWLLTDLNLLNNTGFQRRLKHYKLLRRFGAPLWAWRPDNSTPRLKYSGPGLYTCKHTAIIILQLEKWRERSVALAPCLTDVEPGTVKWPQMRQRFLRVYGWIYQRGGLGITDISAYGFSPLLPYIVHNKPALNVSNTTIYLFKCRSL